VKLNAAELSGWSVRSLVVTPELYRARLDKRYVRLGPSGDEVALPCEGNLETPVWYTNYDPKSQSLASEKNKLTLSQGSCMRLSKESMSITVGLYSFAEPLSLQAQGPERNVRLDKALEWFTLSTKRQTDHQVSTLRETLVGEAAGFLYEDVPGLIPHSTKYEKVRNNYYRLVLVGERTIVAIDVYGTPSSSIEQLQAAAEPVVRALRFEKQ